VCKTSLRKPYKKNTPQNNMIKLKEMLIILIAAVILGFSASWESLQIPNSNDFLMASLIFLVIILVNVVAKKLTANYFDSEIRVDVWKLKRYGFRKSSELKEPVPVGFIIPFIFSIFSLGRIPWYAVLSTEYKERKSRAAKRHGKTSYSKLCEEHTANISASGIFALLILTLISNIFGLKPLAELSIIYTLFNLIPFSGIDGCEIFFGRRNLWYLVVILTVLVLISILLV